MFQNVNIIVSLLTDIKHKLTKLIYYINNNNNNNNNNSNNKMPNLT